MNIKYSDISKPVLTDFFRTFDNRERYITVFDDNKNIVGFLTLKDAAVYLSEGTLHLSKNRPTKHQNNFHSYQIALSILPAYIIDFKDFLINLGNQTIGIDASPSDYNYIKSYIPEIMLQRYEDNQNIDFDVVIILRCPKALQNCLFRTAKIVSISDLLESFLLTDFINFSSEHSLRTVFIEGPITEKLQSTEKYKYIRSRSSLEEILEDEDCISQFCLGDSEQIDYIYNSQYGVLSGNRIITNGISLRSGFFISSKLNVNHNGERKSLYNRNRVARPNIFVFGSCLSFGIFAEDEKTFPSYLQKLINDSDIVSGVVHNMGVKGKALFINDLLLAMQSEVSEHDIMIFVSPISAYSLRILEKNHIEYFNFSEYLNKENNPECFYLNNAYHANVAVYKELAKYSFEQISRFNTAKNLTAHSTAISGFVQNGKNKLFDQKYMWGHIFLKKYMSLLDTLPRPKTGSLIGSVLITANPFTLGHVSLIKRSLENCDYLYVFVVENDSFQYTFSQRMEMVKRYIGDNPKCCVVPSGDIWGSKDLFPEYFKRNIQNNCISITPEDAFIFGNYIASKLRISIRFVGDEPHDHITMQYNQYLEKSLPKYGIKVIQFKRKQNIFGIDIEGKTVRKIISENGIDDEKLHHFLPQSTIEVIKRCLN